MKVVDTLDSAAPWQAFAPDGTTASTELSLTTDTTTARPGSTGASVRLAASAKALDHSLRRSFNGLDLSDCDELRLWINSARIADGSPANPFRLAVRLGSAALGLNAPTNTWRRFLPVMRAASWQPVRLGIGDLPAAVRNAVNVMELRCVAAGTPFTCNLDDIIAVRDAMISDVDAALVAKLDGVLSINGAKVPAVLHPANGALSQARPYIEITHFDIVYSGERTRSTRPSRDFTTAGYTLRPPSNAYELLYQITATADDRLTQSTILDFVLRALTPRGEIVVNNDPLPMEAVTIHPRDQIGGARTDRIPLFYRISTRQEVDGTAEPVAPARTVQLNADYLTASP